MLSTVISRARRGTRTLTLSLIAAAAALAPLAIMVPTVSAATVSTPVNIKTYVGGDSIALTWEPAPGETPTGYGIYRDNYDWLAWVDPSDANDSGANASTTQRYMDDTVVNGQSYTYYISAFDDVYDESALSAAINVTQPASPVPVPTITIPAGRPANVLPYLQAGKALLEDWYPKMVTKSGNLAGTPSSFTITSAPSTGYVAYVSGTTMTVDEGWAIAHVNDPPSYGVFIHEAGHILQNGHTNMPSWMVEGFADYLQRALYANNTAPVPTGYTYLAGYERAGYLFADIEKRWSKPNMIADLNSLMKTGGNIDAFFKTQTGGMSIGELWTNLTGTRISTVLTLKNAAAANSCADVWGSSTASNAPTDIYTCNGTVAQQWTFLPTNSSSAEGQIKTNLGQSSGGGQQQCLTVLGNGTAQGVDVVMAACSSAVGQKWIIQQDGTIRNPNANKCLQPQSSSTTNGTILEIYPCVSTNIQKWGVRTPSTMNSQSAASPYCIDAANGYAAASSWVWVNNCDYSLDQQLTYKQITPGSSAGTYSLNGSSKCLDILNGGSADGTYVVFTNCHYGTSQQWVRNPSMRLSNPTTGKCLQLENNGTALGTYLVISTCNSNTTQKWNWAIL